MFFLTNNTYIFAYVGIIGRRSYLISVAPGICFENVPDVLLSFSLYCLVCQYVKERWLLVYALTVAGVARSGVENNGFEPLTPCLQSRCSSQLS